MVRISLGNLHAVAFYASDTIVPNTEITIHYGNMYYERPYTVGKAAKNLSLKEVRDPPTSCLRYKRAFHVSHRR